MNALPENTEPTLRTILTQRAEQVDGLSIDIAAATARAGRIRRGRRLAAGAALVAAIGLAAPFALGAGRHDASLDPTTPTSTPTSTPSGTPTQGAAPTTLTTADLTDLPRTSPGIAWLDDSGPAPVLHLVDGSQRTLTDPGGPVDQFVLRSDDSVVLHTGEGVSGWSATGQRLFTERATSALLLATDGTLGWAGPASSTGGTELQLRLVAADADTPTDFGPPLDDPGQAVSLSTEAGPDFTLSGADGTVSVSETGVSEAWQGTDLSFVADSFGSGAGESPVMALGPTGSGCGLVRVIDPSATPVEQNRGRACRVSYLSFSPDGTAAAVAPVNSSEPGGSAEGIGMFDIAADRRLWMRTTPPGDDVRVTSPVWEDATHLVAAVRTSRGWMLVRFDARGTATQVSPMVPHPDPDLGVVPVVAQTTP